MIKFTAIRWKNFLSTGNAWTEIELDKSENSLIIGENGSGKSTFLDAITFVLFGKPYRKIGKTDVVNSINNKDCVVEIEFTTSSGQYKVVRGLKPTLFEIHQNGVQLNQDSAQKSQQETLEKLILGMDYKTFTQVVILGSSSFVPFMQLSLSDRRAVIENLLGIEIFSVMSQIVKNRAQINREKIELIKSGIVLASSKKDILERAQKELSKNNEEKIAEIRLKIQEYNKEIVDLKHRLLELEEKTDDDAALGLSLTKVNDKIKQAEVLILKFQSDIRRLNQDIAYLKEHESCSTCKQTIDKSFRDKSILELEQKVLSVSNDLSEIETIKSKSQDKKEQILEQLKEKTKLNNARSSIEFSISSAESLKTRAEKEVKALESKSVFDSSVDEDLDKLNEQIAELERSRIELLSERSYIMASSNMLKENGIKAQIVRVYLPVINKTINHYLTTMGFFASFSLNEEFAETIKSRYVDTMSYNGLSEGEKFRVDLSILLSWRKVAKMKNSVHTNLLVFDEVFDSSLDASGVEEFVKIIWSMEKDINVFVISHKQDQLIDKFSKVYRFEKKRGGWSKLVQA